MTELLRKMEMETLIVLKSMIWRYFWCKYCLDKVQL